MVETNKTNTQVSDAGAKTKSRPLRSPSPSEGRGTAVQRTSAALGRSMPESLASEAAVLGSMIIDPVCIADVIELLGTASFYRIEHQLIFEAIIALYEKNKGDVLDAVLLRDELERRNKLEEVGGVEYLTRIMESVPSSANVIYYAGIVKNKQLLRELIQTATEIVDDAYSQQSETNEMLDEAERKIFAVTDKNVTGGACALKDLVVNAFELIEMRKGSYVTGLATGFHELDELTCGLQNGEMIIIAGRPSMGKTSLALNIAEHIGVMEKMPVAFFSLEMGKQQLAERILCSVSKIDSQLVRKGRLNTEHYKKLQEACGELYDAPIYIDDTSSLTPLQVRAKARRLKSQHDIRCIIVDYLQLMHLGGRVESRQQEITTISRLLKATARELNIPVVVLSQLNRTPEGRLDHRPRMSDLRESGSIEQDADVVILLHRKDYYPRDAKKDTEDITEKDDDKDNTAEVIIAKQRNGPTDTIKLVFIEKFTRFENESHVPEPPDKSDKEIPF